LLDFLQENDVLVGLILGGLLTPLIVDFVKRRWDQEKEERERRVFDFRERQQASLAKRLETLDDITDSYMGFLIGVHFIILDHAQNRLDSELGRRHRSSHDENTQAFLAKCAIFPLRVAQYFERSDILEKRMQTLAGWASEADGAVTLLAENPPEIAKERIDRLWGHLQAGADELGHAVRETVEELAAEVKPDAEVAEDQVVAWSVTEIKALREAMSWQPR
jgi:hypothetical protein